MEQELQSRREISEIREELHNLKELIENLFILLNKKLIKELYKEFESVSKGNYYTEEEFMKRHHLKTL